MSFEIRSAVGYLRAHIQEGEFNALKLIEYLSHENTIWVEELAEIWIDMDIFKKSYSSYLFKEKLWDKICSKCEFGCERVDLVLLNKIRVSDLNNNSSKNNLISALLDIIKQRVKDLLFDIDNDALSLVLNEVRELVESEDNDNE